MANIKKYIVEWPSHLESYAEMHIEVDHDVMTEKQLHEINNFWSGADYRLKESGGSVLNAVLAHLAAAAMNVAVECYVNTEGVVEEFNGDGREGWPPMDGSEGFKITYVNVSEVFQIEDMAITCSD